MKKELYFSPNSIDVKAQDMVSTVDAGRHGEKFTYVPEKSTLLVLDMQSYFLDGDSHAFVPSGKTIIPRLNKLADTYGARNLPVFFTRHVNTNENARLMSSWWRDLILPESSLSRITPELQPNEGMIIEKSQYDAFFETCLEDLLKEKGVSQVVISGVMTHLCCESTARSAFMRGFEVFFLADGTATYNESFHRASLTNLSHGFAEIKLVSDIMVTLQGSSRA